MARPPRHEARVVATPWPGTFATVIASERAFDRHWHDTHGLGWIVEGGHRSASGRGVVDAVAGQVITSNPGEVHDGQPLGAAPRRWAMLYFEPGALRAWLGGPDDASGREPMFVRPVVDDPVLGLALQRVFDRLVAHGRAPARDGIDGLADDAALAEAAAHLGARAHLTGAVTCVTGSHAVARVDADRDMDRVRDRLVETLDASGTAPPLAALAAEIGCSPWQLLRRFARRHGLPPHAWLQQLRVERARTLVRRGVPLADAALAAGYADQSHMTRAMTRQYGFPPSRWQPARGGASGKASSGPR